MDIQHMDVRTKEEIIGQIREKALSYVPEWKFDENFPDMGTVLALVYGDMLVKTLKKYNQILAKNRIAFLNELDARLLSAVPAEGYAIFSLVNESVEGSMVPAKTSLSAQCPEAENGTVNYRTIDDVYASPAVLSCIYQVSDEKDSIWELPVPSKDLELPLFSRGYVNLQRHEFYFSHKEVLSVKNEGWLYLTFYLRADLKVPELMLERLADKNHVRFEYEAEGRYHEFSSRKIVNGSLCLFKSADQPPMEKTIVDGAEGYFIRCTPNVIHGLEEFKFDRLLLRAEGKHIIPDTVLANGVESCVSRYFPFGERLQEFGEVYFASNEALEKKGAWIELSFYMEFTRIMLEYGREDETVQWEWVMKQSDLKSDPEYDITIDTVVWEYYNGTGWARLYPDDRNSRIFYPERGMQGSHRKISFVCPGDMTGLTVNSCEACCIRARIMRINNYYKMKGAYVVPVLEHTVFSYHYPEPGLCPDYLITLNNLEFCHGIKETTPFWQTGNINPALYLGFQTAPSRGPLKFLFLLKNNKVGGGAGLLWEYWNGRDWKEVNLADETKGFSQTGIVTMMGNEDIAKKKLFGRELYWLKISDTEGYFQKPGTDVPILRGIHINAARIISADKEETQYFKMELYQENMRFYLMDKKIMEASVFVDEAGHLSRAEMEVLKQAGLLDIVFDSAGMVKEAWVNWGCKEDSADVYPGERVCLLNRNEGYIAFGNGREGRIPPVSRHDNIRVSYLVGGGTHTNVPAAAVNKLGHEIGFINRVYNPLELSGGCNQETLDRALTRSSAQIRHQNRAITARDFEELALASSRKIRRAVCFPGYDGRGIKTSGALTLVILTEADKDGENDFNEVSRQVKEYLQGKVSGDILPERIAVREPDWVELGVRAEIIVKSFNVVFQVKKQVGEKLEQFLNPFTGNFHSQGFDVGSLPGHIQIKNALSDSGIEGIDYIRSISVTTHIRDTSGLKEIDAARLKDNRYILPVNGKHELTISVAL